MFDTRKMGPCWFVSSASAADDRVVREIRIHLLRLHAEFEVLSAVLDALEDGRLSATRLEGYLERSTGFLERRQVYGHAQPPLLQVAYGRHEEEWPGRDVDLSESLRQLRSSTAAAVERAANPDPPPPQTMLVI